jgi:hypothetical protein
VPSLRDEVSALLETALEEPAEGMTLWSFHVKDRAVPLEEDEIVERIESGAGVYVMELVYDADLELFQRGAGRKIKSARDVSALKARGDAMSASPLPSRMTLGEARGAQPLRAPTDTLAKRSTPLHGAMLQAPSSARAKPARKR